MNNINNILIFEGTTLFVQKKVKIILVSKIKFSCGGKYLVQINDLFCGQIKANNWETTIWDWCPNRLILWVWKTTVSGAKTGKNCPWHLWLMVHFYLTQILTLIWTALVFTDALLFFSLPIPLQDTILYDNLKHCTVWRWSLDQSNNVASLHHCFLHRGHTAE